MYADQMPDFPADFSPFALRHIRITAITVANNPDTGFTPSDVPDLMQDLSMTVLRRMPEMDTAKAQPNTFIARWVEVRVKDLIRFNKKKRRDFRRTRHEVRQTACHLSGDGEESVWVPSEEESDRRLMRSARSHHEQATVQADVAQVLATLPPDLRRVAEMLMYASVAHVAATLGISHQTMHSRELRRLGQAFVASGFFSEFFGSLSAKNGSSNRGTRDARE